MEMRQYLEELEYLVNIDSGKDSPEGLSKVVDFFQERFDGMGWNTHRHDLLPDTGPCLICTNREAEEYDLLMTGHLDTVFPKGTCAERPFRVEGNRAFGPGVLDMKQGSLLMYYILKELPSEVMESLNIVAIFNPDEEIGSIYSYPVYEPWAKKSKYAFIYEGASADGARCIQRKGSKIFTVEFTGKAGHSGYVFTNGSKSAVSEMARWIVRLDSLQSKERNTTANVGVAKGGIADNVVADHALIEVNIRYELAEEADRIDKTLQELCKEAEEHGIGVKISNVKQTPAMIPGEQGLAYAERAKQLAEEHGLTYFHRLRGGLSDGNRIAQFGAICLDAMGPAGDDDHCADEYLLLDSVEPSLKFSKILIEDLAKQKQV